MERGQRHTRIMPKSLLSIHAHPDDESSKGVATVSRYVSQGVRAVLVTATGGEAGDILNSEMDTPEIRANLPQVRADELRVAAGIIGYSDVTMLGYRDSGMAESEDNNHVDAFCRQPMEEVLERLVGIVRRERPDIVLGYDAHEFYPHPDHLMVHRVCLELVEAAADENRFPECGPPHNIQKMYAPIFTSEAILALHAAMIEATGESPYGGWIEPLSKLDRSGVSITSVDVKGFVEQGRDALRAHRTQVDPDGFWFKVPTEIVESVYPWENFELLYSAVGWSSSETDLFEGIS